MKVAMLASEITRLNTTLEENLKENKKSKNLVHNLEERFFLSILENDRMTELKESDARTLNTKMHEYIATYEHKLKETEFYYQSELKTLYS
jgi:hypothetical protein